MQNQIIGKTLQHGYAGSYSRQPDTIIDTHPAAGAIAFGAGVVYGTGGAVRTAATGDTAKIVQAAAKNASTKASKTPKADIDTIQAAYDARNPHIAKKGD